ncbi:hypothetical protein ACG0Z5_08885 [Scandinavium sp. M-37]|uniref:hypothetical protein n=1 Tax=Scandinavium sp. M-37 TaxID=3373077 RepID=UPI0037456BBE
MKHLTVLLLAGMALPALAVGTTDWPAAIQGVASGDAHWIKKTPELAAVADAHQAKQLEDAMSAALKTNTTATLQALRIIDAGKWPHMVGSDLVCTPPAEKSQAEIETFYQRTRSALLETSDGAQCLWILEASIEELKAEKSRQVK